MTLQTQRSPTDYPDTFAGSPVSLQGPNASSRAKIHLSARRLLVFVFMLVIFTGAARPITDPDFWWHLRTGQILAETRGIPHTDIFSVAHWGKEWITHEWLSELAIYSIYERLGYVGLILAFSLIITAAFSIAYERCSKRAGHPYVSGFALVLGALASLPTWGVRPQMFSILFASIFVSILDDYARNREGWSLWWLLPLTIVWVNAHAGFALGIALMLMTVIGLALEGVLVQGSSPSSVWKRVRPLCLVCISCVLGVLFNPNGARMYLYPFETLRSHAMMKYISEWWSPDFHELMFQPLALLVFATFAALALSPKRVHLTDLLLLTATGWATLRSGRNVPFFVLIATPLLAEHAWDWITSHRWGQWLTKPEKREVGANAALKIMLNIGLLVIAPLTLAVVRVTHSVARQPMVNSQQFPAAAVDYIFSERPPPPIYNEYGWGGYLIWRLYPDYRVYIDGRADVYGDAFLEEFLMTHDGETRWQEPLNKNGVRTILVKPDAAIASLLRQEPTWKKVFEDTQAVIFTRR